jgi:putative transposase
MSSGSGFGRCSRSPSRIVERPEPTEEELQNLRLNKGYDHDEVHELLVAWGYTAHIHTCGEEASAKERVLGYRARRWVVERTHSWLN